MFRSLLAFLFVFLSSCTHAPRNVTQSSPAILTLTKSNHVYLNGPIEPMMIIKAQLELLQLSSQLPPGEPIILVINTGGGYVEPGMALIETARGLGRPVHTLSLKAASTGFFIVQYLGERLVLENSQLMTHEIEVLNIGGKIYSTLIDNLEKERAEIEQIDRVVAKRLGLSFSEYVRQIRGRDWRMTGIQAVQNGAADRVVNATCDQELLETIYLLPFETEEGMPMIALISACPLINGPVGYMSPGEAQ